MTIEDSDYSFFGISCTFTPDGGSAATCTVVLHDEEFDRDEDGDIITHRGIISVRQSEVSTRPDYRDKFVVLDGAGTSQTWYITTDGVRENRALKDFGGEWVCQVEHDVKKVLQ